MTERDPINSFKKLLKLAEASGIILPNAMSLATVDKRRKPSVRTMLLKGIDKKGFVFYTNLESRKVRELLNCPYAALCFWWPKLEKQVRVEGPVKKVGDAEADTYFASRPRWNQLAAWASQQSRPLSSRKELLRRFRLVERKFRDRKVPRPSFWSGFVVKPKTIEFWYGKPSRLHHRIVYKRRGNRWTTQLLYP
ncbi:MAG: pyridoxamine 5'-phosphate oxidase [Candidatus Omnitrophica bacterium]|nr:pyridoxamine 5'-phosphate oxidase [Candidatus Omnitrophota bacterium]